jgi:predicted RNA polymerase sigma factor
VRRDPPGAGVPALSVREEWGRVLAILVGFLGDFDLAEDAVQEAFLAAAERWPREGEPENPGAWLVTVAKRRAIERIRREKVLASKLARLEEPVVTEEPNIPDERLELIFTCCHPALNREAQVALTLGDVVGALAITEALELDGYRYLHSTRAELLPRLGRDDEAAAAYRRALALGGNDPERRFLERRL